MKSYKIISYPAMTLLSSKYFDQDKPVYPIEGYTGTWGEEISQISNFIRFLPLTVKSSEYTCLKVYLVQTTKLKPLNAFISEMIRLWKVKYVDELQVTAEHVISSSLRCVHITLSHNNLNEKKLTQMSALNLISRFEVTHIVRIQSVTDNSYILHIPPAGNDYI